MKSLASRRLPKAAWRNGGTIRIADAHRDDGRRFVVHADEKPNNARSAPIKKNHLYPPFLSTSRKKWEDSTAQKMIQEDCKSVCKALPNRIFRIRKPPFYPLNYGNNDLERINGLNGDGQDTLAVRGDFSRGELCARLSAACLRVSLRGHFHVNPYGCRD